jgi:hypothetical protein
MRVNRTATARQMALVGTSMLIAYAVARARFRRQIVRARREAAVNRRAARSALQLQIQTMEALNHRHREVEEPDNAPS